VSFSSLIVDSSSSPCFYSIDSGVDYEHPALGQGIGPGKKIIGGYDFAGNNYDGKAWLLASDWERSLTRTYTGYNDPVPDDDPIDTCDGHGTHVAVCYPDFSSPS
jgi:subtilisin family serine protease